MRYNMQQRHSLLANAIVKSYSLLAQCSHCTPEDTKFSTFVPGCMWTVQAAWTAFMHASASTCAMSGLTMTKQLQAASYYCDVCVCKHMEYLLHVAPHACHPASIVQMVKSVFGVQGTV